MRSRALLVLLVLGTAGGDNPTAVITVVSQDDGPDLSTPPGVGLQDQAQIRIP